MIKTSLQRSKVIFNWPMHKKLTIFIAFFLVLIVATKSKENLVDFNKRLTHAILRGEVRGDGNLPKNDSHLHLVVELRFTRDHRPRPIGRTRISIDSQTKINDDSFRFPFNLKYPLAKINPHNTYILSARIRNGQNQLLFVGDLPVPVTERVEEKAKHLVIPMIRTPSWYKNIKKLSPLAYKVTQLAGTEEAFTSDFYTNKRKGIYTCVVCNQTLFSSEHKYLSGTGWPSFYQPIDSNHVATNIDRKYGLTRTEVHCSQCKAHLGHVFDDGPPPTYSRFCMNGVSLQFYPK